MPLFGGSRPTGSQCLFVPLRVETKRDIYSENGVPVFVSTLFVPCLYLVCTLFVPCSSSCCCCCCRCRCLLLLLLLFFWVHGYFHRLAAGTLGIESRASLLRLIENHPMA